jgi:hypothetical protein
VRSALALAAVPHEASPVCKTVTLSIGAACRTPQPRNGADQRVLIEEADRLLYLAIGGAADETGRVRALGQKEEERNRVLGLYRKGRIAGCAIGRPPSQRIR